MSDDAKQIGNVQLVPIDYSKLTYLELSEFENQVGDIFPELFASDEVPYFAVDQSQAFRLLNRVFEEIDFEYTVMGFDKTFVCSIFVTEGSGNRYYITNTFSTVARTIFVSVITLLKFVHYI